MPQLNPLPWFLIFTATWAIIIILAPKKILKHTLLNSPQPKAIKTAPQPWNWPWQ